jgi:hypothetical protein
MTAPSAQSGADRALVPAELRGYRRFDVTEAGLCPTVRGRDAAWDGSLEHARCLAGRDHAPPAPDCGCGLYAWHHPDDARADSGFGTVTAVIAARGRVVLHDSGFRATAARVEAVALPQPAGRTRTAHEEVVRRIAEIYPQAVIYPSRGQMLRAHPPHDLRSFGLEPGPSPASRHRRQAVTLWLLGLLGLYALIAVLARSGAPSPGQVLVGLALFVAWQTALIRLVGSATATDAGAPAVHRGAPSV